MTLHHTSVLRTALPILAAAALQAFVAGHGDTVALSQEPSPMLHGSKSSWPAVPRHPATGAEPDDAIKELYEFVAGHADLYRHVACFCHCGKNLGHGSTYDCFVKHRTARDAPFEWNPHGMMCRVCIDVAREAERLHEYGHGVETIQAAIDAKYTTLFGADSRTPTPKLGRILW